MFKNIAEQNNIITIICYLISAKHVVLILSCNKIFEELTFFKKSLIRQYTY